ncbi:MULTISPECIES: outer membrane protein assembly factor BamB family protein [unclassified Schlesneria]|uniref:outer membrane protein assembly factor BamB family protein n=1 Tax=unclassified Schlesneria TaxID=2762017 RepID=UPI002F04A6CE
MRFTFPRLFSSLVCVALGCGGAVSTTFSTSLVHAADELAKAKSASPGKATVRDERPGIDWPIFLGPHGTGISDEKGLLDEWPEDGPEVLWGKRIGKGYSSPSILDGHVVVHHRQRDRDVIECLTVQNGERLWTHEYETDFSDPYGYNNGPRCSPVLTANRCYTFGAQGRLVCLDLQSGKLIWEVETTKKWNVPEHFFGAGCTPILEGNLLIVLVGGQPNSGVVAFNAETGEVVWESVGKDTWDGVPTDQAGKKYRWTGDEMVVSYSSPIVATIHGTKHLLCLVRHGLVSLDPTNGNVRFKYWFRSRVHESVNAARPVVVDDTIFLSAAYETGAALLKVKPDEQDYEVVWRNKRGMSTHWSTPIFQDGCIYGFSGRHEGEAMLQCVDLKSGELLWETNGFEGAPTELRASPDGGIVDREGKPVTFFGRGSKTAVDGKFIMLGERGILVLGKLSRDKYEQISRAVYPQIRYPAWAAPVVSHGRLYLRGEDYLICLDIAKAEASAK